MITNDHRDMDMNGQGRNGQGRETLSALFDGELRGDAARFAMKRLGHDPQWRQAFGNWQLVGDAMRGQASSVAPAGFAARVAAAVAGAASQGDVALIPAVVNDGRPAPMAARRKWIGGAALAASVAMVAMFVARPFSEDAGMAPGVAPGVAVPAAVELVAAPAPVPAEANPALPDPALAVGAALIAVAEVPRRAIERRSRGQSERVALRASNRPVQAAVPATASPATAPAATSVAMDGPLAHPAANPFGPPPVDVVSRPWPRAVLPAATANPAFTASFGTGAASSPSFYPFEPRLPHANDAGPAPTAGDEPRR